MPLINSKGSKANGSAPKPADEDEVERSVDEMLADLASESAQVRRGAARGLGDHPGAAAVLCTAVAAEPQESVREAIFTALIRIGTKPAAAGLVPLLQSEDVGLRNGAIEALKTMPDAVADWVGEIFADCADVRIFGVEILGALGHPKSPSWLIEAIEHDPDVNVCAAAVEALAHCGDATATAPLLRLVQRFPDEPFLAFAVQTALSRIAGD